MHLRTTGDFLSWDKQIELTSYKWFESTVPQNSVQHANADELSYTITRFKTSSRLLWVSRTSTEFDHQTGNEKDIIVRLSLFQVLRGGEQGVDGVREWECETIEQEENGGGRGEGVHEKGCVRTHPSSCTPFPPQFSFCSIVSHSHSLILICTLFPTSQSLEKR